MKESAAALIAALLLSGTCLAAQATGPIYTAGENGVTKPVVVKEVKPRYPKAMLDAKKSAVVILDCVVLPDGRPAEVRVRKQGDRAFDRAAVNALEQWKFKPGVKDGKPVPVRVEVELTFTVK